MANIYALIMGRAGSEGVPGKNIRQVAGNVLVMHPLVASMSAHTVDRVYVSTDCPVIKKTAMNQGAWVIDRPATLSRSDSEMSDVIIHAVDSWQHMPDVVVTMHANCGIHPPGLIDECVNKLLADPELDSVVSARVVDDLHPYRLKRVRPDGTLTTWVDMPEDTSNNRQAIKDKAVVLDGACRAFRPERCLPPLGQPPFRYLGNTIGWVENPHGFDVHSEADLLTTERWLESQRDPFQSCYVD